MDADEIGMPERFGGGIDLTATDFELAVKSLLDLEDKKINSFVIRHNHRVNGSDADFNIDIYIEFEFIGLIYRTLVECKKYKNPIKREIVEILRSRLISTGAQKGIIVSTSNYQRGAVEFAQKNGIALVQLGDGKKTYVTKSFGRPQAVNEPENLNVSDIWGWKIQLNSEGNPEFSVIGYQGRKIPIT